MAHATKRRKANTCPHGAHPLYCAPCIRERCEDEAMDRELDELAHRDTLIRSAAPATDREWREHLAAWDPNWTLCAEVY